MTRKSVFDTVPEETVHSFEELRSLGMLWLINRVVFHPRGFALALVPNDDGTDAVGWRMYGDGAEPVAFDDATDDECFAFVTEFLKGLEK
jgi:hypothetical protein